MVPKKIRTSLQLHHQLLDTNATLGPGNSVKVRVFLKKTPQ